MMRAKELSVLLLWIFAAFVSAAVAQSQPDFSGTWKQNAEKSPTKTSLKSSVNKVEQKGTTLKVTTIAGGNRERRKTYTIGKEERSQDRDGDEMTTLVKMEGQSLVFETSEKERNKVLTTREAWSLSDDGKTLTKTIQHSGGKDESEQKYVFDKQP